MTQVLSIEDLSEYQTYSKLKAQGFTIYRNSDGHRLYLVAPGESHSAAWRAVKAESA